MAVCCDEFDRVAVLAVEGDLDAAACEQARALVDGMIESRQVVDFVVDLGRCPHVTSQGLEMLLWVKRRAEELFGRVALAQADATVSKILEMTRLASRFESCPDVEAAMKLIRH